MFQRILVPLDGSPRAEHAIPIAARLARASGGSVILLRVVNEAHEYWSSMTVSSSMLAEAERYLAELKASPDLQAVSTETLVLSGRAAPSILSAASSSHVGVIVMCSHGYTGMKRWALGSVAEKVTQAAVIPVLLLREGGSLPMGSHVDDTRPLRILVPLDGSVLAKTALVPAAYLIAALATFDQGTLHVLRVATFSATTNEEEQERLLHRAKEYLRTTAEQIREGFVAHPIAELKLPVVWSTAVDTDVAEAIIRVAENGGDAEGAGVFGGCDVIAMATHGLGGLDSSAMGSMTERVLHATKLPMLIIRPTLSVSNSHSTEEKAITATFLS